MPRRATDDARREAVVRSARRPDTCIEQLDEERRSGPRSATVAGPIRAPSSAASASTTHADDDVRRAEGERRVLREPLVEHVPRGRARPRLEQSRRSRGAEEEPEDEAGIACAEAAAERRRRAHASEATRRGTSSRMTEREVQHDPQVLEGEDELPRSPRRRSTRTHPSQAELGDRRPSASSGWRSFRSRSSSRS